MEEIKQKLIDDLDKEKITKNLKDFYYNVFDFMDKIPLRYLTLAGAIRANFKYKEIKNYSKYDRKILYFLFIIKDIEVKYINEIKESLKDFLK